MGSKGQRVPTKGWGTLYDDGGGNVLHAVSSVSIALSYVGSSVKFTVQGCVVRGVSQR